MPSIIQTKIFSIAANAATAVFDSTPTEGNLICLAARSTSEVLGNFTWPAGFAEIAKYLRASETLVVFGKIAGAGESNSYAVSNAVNLADIIGFEIDAVAGDFAATIGTFDSNTATSSATIQCGASGIVVGSGSLVVALASTSTADLPPTSYSDGFTEFTNGLTLENINGAYLSASAGTVNTTFTYAGSLTRRSSVIFEVAGASGSVAPIVAYYQSMQD